MTTITPAGILETRSRTPLTLHVSSVLLGLLATATATGSFIFRTPGSGLFGDTLLLVLVAGSIGMLTAALRLHRGQRLIWNLARSLAGLHVLWSIYKVFFYGGTGEAESWPFLIVGVLITVLLHLPGSLRFVRSGGR